MSEGIPYADILILALIAGFILLRLRSVLGSKSNDDPFLRPPAPSSQEPIVRLEDRALKNKLKEAEPDEYVQSLESGSDIAAALAAIKAKDALFSASEFLRGARMAYEMVFDAFAKGDKQTLSMLLAATPLKAFTDVIDHRPLEENDEEITLVSTKARDITHASLQGSVARLSVQFESEQVIVKRNSKGDIVEGDPSEIHHIEDEWVFERDITSKNPNWKIIET